MKTLDECLATAARLVSDPEAVRKSGFTRADFDRAIEDLASIIQKDDERYHSAYARAFDSPDGQLLYRAREMTPKPLEIVRKREPDPPLSPAEKAIAQAVKKHMEAHPRVPPERALMAVLDAEPGLYAAYNREDPVERWRGGGG